MILVWGIYVGPVFGTMHLMNTYEYFINFLFVYSALYLQRMVMLRHVVYLIIDGFITCAMQYRIVYLQSLYFVKVLDKCKIYHMQTLLGDRATR